MTSHGCGQYFDKINLLVGDIILMEDNEIYSII